MKESFASNNSQSITFNHHPDVFHQNSETRNTNKGTASPPKPTNKIN
jgi:hypothetical protein